MQKEEKEIKGICKAKKVQFFMMDNDVLSKKKDGDQFFLKFEQILKKIREICDRFSVFHGEERV